MGQSLSDAMKGFFAGVWLPKGEEVGMINPFVGLGWGLGLGFACRVIISRYGVRVRCTYVSCTLRVDLNVLQM